VRVEVQAQQGVGGDHGIGPGDELAKIGAAAGERVGDRHHPQSGGEPRRLSRPVRHDAGGRDDEKRRTVWLGLPGMADQRQRLQRLAEAHVIGKDAAEAVLPQER
jgi:hypothetical protein